MTLYGIYDSFTYGQDRKGLFSTAGSRLAAIKAAGLDLVLNYGTGAMGPADNLIYAAEAQSAGVRVIWNPWRDAVSWSGDWLEAVRDHPATWGYYVGDEAAPGSAEASAVRSLARVLGRLGKPTLYISRPGKRALRPFLDVATHVGPDCYPIGKPASWAKPDPQRIGDVAQWAREMVNEPGGARKLAFVCQAFSWSVDYPAEPQLPWPDAETMAAMRRAVERRGHPDLLLWFCMHCITDYARDPESYWKEFVSACRPR